MNLPHGPMKLDQFGLVVEALDKLHALGWDITEDRDKDGTFWKCKMPGACAVITRSIPQLRRYAGLANHEPNPA